MIFLRRFLATAYASGGRFAGQVDSDAESLSGASQYAAADRRESDSGQGPGNLPLVVPVRHG